MIQKKTNAANTPEKTNKKRKISLGISTCPNDTYIFYALLNGKIDHNLDIDLHFADVQELNQLSIEKKIDISKISIHAYAHLHKDYYLLRSGGAMGHNCGPLLIAHPDHTEGLSHFPSEGDIQERSWLRQRLLELQPLLQKNMVLIPGKLTTAYLYLKLAFPDLENIEERLFSEIIPNVTAQRAAFGLIIHESRFTYQENGLLQLLDLGNWWEAETGNPIPLGGITAKKDLPASLLHEIEELIRKSILYAQENEEETLEFCRSYAQEMKTEVMRSHIDLYVNEYSLNLGESGEQAIHKLMGMAWEKGLIRERPEEYFLEKQS